MFRFTHEPSSGSYNQFCSTVLVGTDVVSVMATYSDLVCVCVCVCVCVWFTLQRSTDSEPYTHTHTYTRSEYAAITLTTKVATTCTEDGHKQTTKTSTTI